jgi:hypothetical protein
MVFPRSLNAGSSYEMHSSASGTMAMMVSLKDVSALLPIFCCMSRRLDWPDLG